MATGKQRGDDDASRREALLNADVRKEEWRVAAPASAAGGDDGEKPLGRRVLEESRLLWEIVAPAIFSRVATFSMNVITQAFAGHLGDLELAAISIANTVIVGFNFGLMVRTHVPPRALLPPYVTIYRYIYTCSK
jgi:MATE family multidrug resistance protein